MLELVYWNATLRDWDHRGVFRDNATILASGDNCTFVGYTTHFTFFTVGVFRFQLNSVDVVTVRPGQKRTMEAGHRGSGPWKRAGPHAGLKCGACDC